MNIKLEVTGLKRTEHRFWTKVDKRSAAECWEWTAGRHRRGYGKYSVNRSTLPAHRVAWVLTHGEIPEGLLVCHACDNPPCVNPAHLFLGTAKDNAADRDTKGRANTPVGERSAFAKLTDSEVLAIRACAAEPLKALATRYHVSAATISRVRHNLIWKHLDAAA